MKQHNFYRHDLMLDVDVYVLTVYKSKTKVKVKVAYITRNRGDVVGWEKISIEKSELKKWRNVTNEYEQ